MRCILCGLNGYPSTQTCTHARIQRVKAEIRNFVEWITFITILLLALYIVYRAFMEVPVIAKYGVLVLVISYVIYYYARNHQRKRKFRIRYIDDFPSLYPNLQDSQKLSILEGIAQKLDNKVNLMLQEHIRRGHTQKLSGSGIHYYCSCGDMFPAVEYYSEDEKRIIEKLRSNNGRVAS